MLRMSCIHLSTADEEHSLTLSGGRKLQPDSQRH